MSDKKKTDVYSAPYTKAGLANKSAESGDDSENETVKRGESDSTERTPKISKNEAAERERDKPVH